MYPEVINAWKEVRSNMDDPTAKPQLIDCSVLRLGGYQPGRWLLSDLNNELTLYTGDRESLGRSVAATGVAAQGSIPPILWLVREQVRGGRPKAYATPVCGGPFAFGGNWLWSEDARFPFDHPIPIHDAIQSG